MKKHAANPTTTHSAHGSQVPVRDLKIIQSFADTTWRIAVPVVGLTLLGIYGDKNYGTKPWLTLTGSVLGFVLAGLLVKRQITAVMNEYEDENE